MRPSLNILCSLSLALVFCLSACGTKGPLVMPPAKVTTAKPAPAADDSKAATEPAK